MKSMMIVDQKIRIDENGVYCLNDLHKAAMAAGKATESQAPSKFLRSQAEFISALEVKGQICPLRIVKGGRNSGSWAIEIVAMKYAGWIDASYEVQVYAATQALRHGDIEKAVELSGSKEARRALDDKYRAQTINLQIKNAKELCELLPHLGDTSKQAIAASLVNPVAGFEIIPLPQITEHHHTATEVGERLGISAARVGRIANEHNLKTEQHGMFFLDKSPHSSKQVETFRYNEAGIEAIKAKIPAHLSLVE